MLLEKLLPASAHLGQPRLPAVLPPQGGLCRLARAQAGLAPEPRAAKRAAFLPAVFQSNRQIHWLPRPRMTCGGGLGALPMPPLAAAPPARASTGIASRPGM